MQSNSTQESTDGQGSNSRGLSRRRLLKTTSAAVVGAAGVGLASNSAAGQWFGGGSDIPELDFRGGNPAVSDAPTGDEVVFNIHGYSGSTASVSQAEQFQSTVESVGYTGEVAAVTWEDSGLPTSAEASARETGQRMAGYIEDYIDQNPETNVRLLGHSMGGFVVMELVGALSQYSIENADMIGSYEEDDAPCEGNFYSAIESNVSFMGNYHSSNDSIARLGQDGASCGGIFGGGDTPPNYEDVDVSSSVGSHTTYKSSTGCVQQIVDNHVDEIDRGGSGTSSTSGTSTTSGSSAWFGSDDGGSDDGGSFGWF